MASESKYSWKRAMCPSCGKTVWFSEPITVATVPTAFAHLVPQTTMGECGHTVSVRFPDDPDEFETVNRAMVEPQQAARAGA